MKKDHKYRIILLRIFNEVLIFCQLFGVFFLQYNQNERFSIRALVILNSLMCAVNGLENFTVYMRPVFC